MTPFLFTKHDELAKAIETKFGPVQRRHRFTRALLSAEIPNGSPVWGNLPVPAAQMICAAGCQYFHVIIPNLWDPDAFTYESLLRNVILRPYNVELVR